MTTANHPTTTETSAPPTGCPDWCVGTCEWQHDLVTNSPIRWHEVAGWGHGVYAGCDERPTCSTCQDVPTLTDFRVRVDTDRMESMDATKARELAGYLIEAAAWLEANRP